MYIVFAGGYERRVFSVSRNRYDIFCVMKCKKFIFRVTNIVPYLLDVNLLSD